MDNTIILMALVTGIIFMTIANFKQWKEVVKKFKKYKGIKNHDE